MTGTRNLKIWLTMCSLLLALVNTAAGVIRRVPADYSTIQAAINAASGGDEIAVASGTYNETIDFNGKALRLYSTGGPAVTTINGGGADHVVQCVSGEGPDTILEGFTITGGNADGASYPDHNGGGMLNSGTSPTVINCTFSGNSANFHGGGMYNWQSSPTVTDCTFSTNTAVYGYGGGMCNAESNPTVTNCTFSGNTANTLGGGGLYNDISSPAITNCTFTGNTANRGGGMFSRRQSSPTVTDCTFSQNTASLNGAGIYNEDGSSPEVTRCTFTENTAVTYHGGGMYSRVGSNPEVTDCIFTSNKATVYGGGMHNSGSRPTVTNCTFTGNSANEGGGMSNYGGSSPTVTNCTFRNNDASLQGDGIYTESGSATVTNCILWGDSSGQIVGSAAVTYSDVQGDPDIIWPGEGNINADPQFADDDGRLSFGSPCIDSGHTGAVSVATDLDGNPRVMDGDFDGIEVVDMGAYEFQGGRIHNVTRDRYYTRIQTAVDDATDGDQIEVIPGTYYEAIDFKGKAIHLSSTGGAEVTTIDATDLGTSVVTCASGEGPGTILDGFTITGGIGTTHGTHRCGGGMYINGSSPTLEDCIFSKNKAIAWSFYGGYGGGMYNNGGSPTLTNCTFYDNEAMGSDWLGGETGKGGGMHNHGGSPTLINCTFHANRASGAPLGDSPLGLPGGGMFNYESSPTVRDNCTFERNSPTGMSNQSCSPTVINCAFRYQIWGMANLDWASPTVTNCIFAANVEDGLYSFLSSPTVTNCRFSGNGKAGMANWALCSSIVTNCTFFKNSTGIFNYTSNSNVTNCILWDNEYQIIDDFVSFASVTYSDVQGGWGGTGNIDLDPKFGDDWGRLSPGSPCIDAGGSGAVSVDTDLDGKQRIMLGYLNGVAAVDMGAYEYEYVWIDADADGIEDHIDKACGVYSNDFRDGSISGTIVDRRDQVVVVADAPAPDSVMIMTRPDGGTRPAWIRLSDGTNWGLDPGEVVEVKSGSIEITVVQGTVEITFVAVDGTEAQATLNAGNGVEFEPETFVLTAPPTNTEEVVIVVGDEVLVLTPGENRMFAWIDIDPDTLNLGSEGGWITCYIELPLGFDVGAIDVSTVKLNGTVPAQPRPTQVGDYDKDGVPDLMVKFDHDLAQETLEAGDAVPMTVAGTLNDGTEFEGCDMIRVMPSGNFSRP